MKDPYSFLGVSSYATDEEIKNAYRALARKYHPDNFGDDNPLKDIANEKMQEINLAYDEIQSLRAAGSAHKGGDTYSQSYGSSTVKTNREFVGIRKCINEGKFFEAERRIAETPISDRNAEWHYLNSVLLMHNGNVNDAMSEHKIALSLDPTNAEYQMSKEMFNNAARGKSKPRFGFRRRKS